MSVYAGEKHTAIVVAGGSGSRMGSDIPKQYLMLAGRPVICGCLEAFEKSEVIDEVIVVAAENYVNYCRNRIADAFGFSKVKKIVPGGAQRYGSVYEGLKAAGDADYVYIHDAARPCLSQDLISRLSEAVRIYDAATAAVPVKDTIKSADAQGFVVQTLDRSTLWCIQTPQVFSYPLLKNAYETMLQGPHSDITDDNMVIERFTDQRIRLVEGSYMNQKITTPEDLPMMEVFISRTFDRQA